jgi:hypothetical protein
MGLKTHYPTNDEAWKETGRRGTIFFGLKYKGILDMGVWPQNSISRRRTISDVGFSDGDTRV